MVIIDSYRDCYSPGEAEQDSITVGELITKLQNYNPAITKFSRIWVDIFDDHPVSNQELTKETIQSNDTGRYLEYKESKNLNVLQFPDEGVVEDIDGVVSSPNLYWPEQVYNRGLSGWYVVTEIEIEYDYNDNNLKMNLLLNRIEYKPSFKSDYDLAREAIKIYKEDNLIDDILKTS